MIFVTCYVSQFTVEDSTLFFFTCVRWCKKCGCEHTELHNYFVCTYNTRRKYVGVQKVLIQGNYLSNLWLHSLGKITLELHSINDKCLIRFSLMVVEKMFFETCLLTAMEFTREDQGWYIRRILGVPTE